MEFVSKALHTNDIAHSKLLRSGGRKGNAGELRKFYEQPDVRVMLLALKAGAAGLTLVQASNVFLLEPTIDPAVEQQAVARVHRIGQTRPVVCTRLLVRQTVEEAVLKARGVGWGVCVRCEGGDARAAVSLWVGEQWYCAVVQSCIVLLLSCSLALPQLHCRTVLLPPHRIVHSISRRSTRAGRVSSRRTGTRATGKQSLTMRPRPWRSWRRTRTPWTRQTWTRCWGCEADRAVKQTGMWGGVDGTLLGMGM